MKNKFLTAVAGIAIVASGVVAKAQETPKHDRHPAGERVEPKAEPAK